MNAQAVIRLWPKLSVAGLVIAGMTALTPVADAQTEQQIKSGCDEAGGTYSTVPNPNSQYSECCYHDSEGKPFCDTYINGSYTGTFPGDKRAPPISGPNGPPPANNAPIATNAPPAAH